MTEEPFARIRAEATALEPAVRIARPLTNRHEMLWPDVAPEPWAGVRLPFRRHLLSSAYAEAPPAEAVGETLHNRVRRPCSHRRRRLTDVGGLARGGPLRPGQPCAVPPGSGAPLYERRAGMTGAPFARSGRGTPTDGCGYAWTVHGCEVITTNPGAPAAQAGLIGRDQRFDAVGDVITSLADPTDGNATWAVPSCATLRQAIAQTRAGDRVTIDYCHRQVVLLFGKWVAESGTATLTNGANPGCPAALTGTITPALAGNRIDLDITLSGPAGSRSGLHVILDTGGVDAIFPDRLLRSLGYQPYASGRGAGVVPGATDTEHLYRVPAGAITVLDQGTYAPLATGTLTVIGIPGGTDYGLGPDILKHGAKLSTSGDQWILTPPCG